MEFLSDPNVWIAFAMLTALEIVLGIDNIIFISILVGRLPPEQRDKIEQTMQARAGKPHYAREAKLHHATESGRGSL